MIIERTSGGQLIQTQDLYTTYYYVADDLGTPAQGAYLSEEKARQALDGTEIAPDQEMTEDGRLLHECGYCRALVTCEEVPDADDDSAWDRLSEDHADGCEWIATRAHRHETA